MASSQNWKNNSSTWKIPSIEQTSTEAMIDELFNPNDYSAEAYFGLSHPFSSEMISHVDRLREEIRRLLGSEWANKEKTLIIMKNALESKSDTSSLNTILDSMGKCVAKHCNIEKCYFAVHNAINAYTLPMIMDSSILLTSLDESFKVERDEYGYKQFFLKPGYIRSPSDIQRKFLKLEDIVLNKNGYRFKSGEGKVMIINIGIPLIIDNNFEATTNDICAVIFHEIGHNFQQLLHGSNQMMMNYYIRSCLSSIANKSFFDIFALIENVFIHSHLKVILENIEDSKMRFNIIRIILFSGVYIDNDGKVISRNKIGEMEQEYIDKAMEQEYIDKAIEQARRNNTLPKLSLAVRIIGGVGKTIGKIIHLVFLPIKLAHDAIHHNNLNNKYSEIIKNNKSYEQFADLFAVSYGFGGNSSKFYLSYISLIHKSKPILPTHLGILNYIPILSVADKLNELNCRKMYINTAGYDEDYIRIAQIYKALDYELSHNKDLTPKLKKEIIEHMEVVKNDYDRFLKLESEAFSSNPSISKKIIEKLRKGTISEVADESGFVENVLEVVSEYEKNNTIKQPPAVKKFMELNDIDKLSSNNKLLDNFFIKVDEVKQSLTSTLNNIINKII